MGFPRNYFYHFIIEEREDFDLIVVYLTKQRKVKYTKRT